MKGITTGNLLLSIMANEIIKADWLVIKHIEDGNRHLMGSIEKVYEPITLTEEWLLKFGFVKTSSRSFEGEIGALTIIARFYSKWYLEIRDGLYLGGRIQYVHEYQNLYFAWTGQELEVNL